MLNNLFEYHGCLNAVAAHQTLAAAVRCSNRVQAITLLSLMVNRFFQFGQVAGTGAKKFFLQSNLQDNVMIVLAVEKVEESLKSINNTSSNLHDYIVFDRDCQSACKRKPPFGAVFVC